MITSLPPLSRSGPPLLVVGHGTRDPAGVAQFQALVARVRGRAQGLPVAGGLIELAPPPVSDAVAELTAAGHRRLAAVPLVLVAAGHAKGDIPASLARERERHPGLSYAYGRPLGPHPALLALLQERLDAVLAPEERAGTAVLLVGRGSSDPDANAEVHKVARLLEEGQLGGSVLTVETAFVSLAAPGVPAGLERCRRLGAERVVVLPYFLFAGVLPDRITDQARAWAGGQPGLDVRRADLIGDCDGLADLVLERYAEALGGDLRMNCDTCVYRTVLPGSEIRVGAPQRPHSHPDDPAHQHDPAHPHDPGHHHGPSLGRVHEHRH